MSATRKTIGAVGTLAVITAIAATAVGCGGSSTTKTTSTAPVATETKLAATATKPPDPTAGPAGADTEGEQTVAVSLTEWTISGPAGAALGPLKAGEIKFDVHNDGTTQHEFVLIKTDAAPGSFAVTAGKVDEETLGESPGEADDIEAGEAKTATMRLSPGKYVYICNVAGHYTSGMRGQLIVQ